MATSRALLCAGAVLVIATTTAIANAAPDAKSRAAKLFDEASKALADKRYDEACRMLEESDRLERAVGTEYNLAQCLELQGRVESARRTFEKVAELARQSGKDSVADRAVERAQALSTSVPHLVLRVPGGVVDVSVDCDGKALTPAEIAAPIALDPGVHKIHAAARDRRSFDAEATLTRGRTTDLAVDLPPSPGASSATASAEPAPGGEQPSEGSGMPLRPIGLVVAGVGVVALGVGGLFALRSISARDDAGCDHGRCPDEASADRLRDAGTKADLTTIFTIAGAALTAGGLTLFFLAPSRASGARPTAHVTPNGANIAFEGAF